MTYKNLRVIYTVLHMGLTTKSINIRMTKNGIARHQEVEKNLNWEGEVGVAQGKRVVDEMVSDIQS
jgi:hypothetical protein